MLREWSRRVHAGDTIICLGDVAHSDAWRDRRLVLDVRNCPGERVLVLGNHDVDTVNQVRPLEVHRTAVTLAAPGEPPGHPPIDTLLIPAVGLRRGQRVEHFVRLCPHIDDAAGSRLRLLQPVQQHREYPNVVGHERLWPCSHTIALEQKAVRCSFRRHELVEPHSEPLLVLTLEVDMLAGQYDCPDVDLLQVLVLHAVPA